MQVICKLTSGYALLDLLPTNKEELAENVKVYDSVMRRIEFKILREVISWETVLEGKGAQDRWLVFKDNLLRMQEWSSVTYEKLRKFGRRP